MAGGVELAAAYVTIIPSFRNMGREISREFGGVERAAESTGKSAGAKLASGLKNGAKIAGGAVAAILGTALVKGFSRLSAIENAEASLKGLGNSAGDVKNIMKDALGAVKGTAFGMDEAAQTAAGAVAAGIKPGKDLARTLGLVGDAATIGKTSMADMGSIFNKVATSGKIQGDVLNQLSDKGIPIVALLSKELGKTAEETVALASKGKINFATFQDAMEAGMGGAALKSGETTAGAFKNMNAALGRLGAGLLKGAFPLFGKVFGGITGMIDKLEEKLTPLATLLSVKLAGGLSDLAAGFSLPAKDAAKLGSELTGFVLVGYNVQRVFNEMRGGITAFGAAWKYNDGDITSSGFTGFMERAAYVVHQLVDAVKMLDFTSFQGFLDSLKSAGGPAGNAMGSIGDSVRTLIPAFKEFAKQLPNIGGAIAKVAAVGLTVLTGALAFLASHVDTIIKFMPLIVAGFIAYKVASLVAAKGTFALQAAQVAMTPVITLNNILRLTAIRLEGRQTTALAASTVAQIQNNGAQNAGLIGKTRYVLALAAQRAATIGATIATNAATFAQKALNLALRMNPIGIIITVIAALVAGFILAYNKIGWFKDGVNAAIGAVGAVFRWLWDNAVKPVFDGIMVVVGAVVGWFQSYALPVIQKVIADVGDVFKWLWNTVIKPVFESISVIIGGVWAFIKGVFGLIVALVQNVLAPAFKSLWENVIKPAFKAIGDFIGWVWSTVIKVVFNAIKWYIDNVIAPVFTWLWEKIIKPVFNWISSAISWAWNNVIKPVFAALKWYIDNVLAPVFSWLWKTIIKPAFDGIGKAIKWAWDKVIKPVFNFLKDAITKDVPEAFQKGIDGIKRIWEKIQDIAKKPVRFLINTVINDGIIGAFNKLVGLIDPGNKFVKPLGDVGLPAGFRKGGYTGKGHAGEYAGPVHRDEHVIKSPSRRSIEAAAPGLLESMNQHGASALAGFNGTGGNRLGLFGGFARGIANSGKVFVRDNAAGWDVPGAIKAWQGVSGLKLAIGNGSPGINVTAAPMNVPGWGTGGYGYSTGPNVTLNSHQNGLPAGLKRAIAAHEIGHSLGLGHINSPASIMHPAVATAQWPTGFDLDSMRMAYGAPGAGAKRYGPGDAGESFPANPFTGLADSLMGKLKSAFPGGGMFLDAAVGMAKMGIDKVMGFVKNLAGDIGAKIAGVTSSVVDGIKGIFGFAGPAGMGAPTLFDGGGWLTDTGRPQLIDHQRRKPDAVLTNEQFADMHTLAMDPSSRGMTYSPTYQWAGDDPHAVMDRDKARMRDTFAMYSV